MTILKSTTFAGGTAGQVGTPATLGVDAIQGTGLVFNGTSPIIGSMSATTDAGTTAVSEVEFDFTSNLTTFAAELVFRVDTLPGAGGDLLQVRGSGGNICKVGISASNKLTFYDSTTTTPLKSFATALVAGQVYRVEVSGTIGGSSTGSLKCDYYASMSTATAAETGYTATGTSNTGTSTVLTTVRGGKDTAQGLALTLGKFAAQDANTYIGPVGSVPAPSVATGATTDIAAGASASFTSTGTSSGGTIASASASFTILPPGAAAPTLTGTATGTGTASAALNQTATLVTPGLYVWTPVYSDGTLTGQASQSAYVSAAAGTYADCQAVVLGANTNVGGATTPQAAISDTNPATYLEGAPGSPLRATLPPLPLGPITIEDSALWATGAVTRTLTLYMADGTTVVSTTSYGLTNAEVATAWTAPDASNRVTTVPLRRALIFQSQDA